MILVRFADLVHLNTDRIADPLAAGIERFVGLEHIEPENLHIRSWGNVADGVTFTNKFKPGQVLFGKRRAYQRKVAVADFEGVCSSDIYVFESKDPNKLLPELLPFICQSERFFEYAVKTSAGSLSPRTNWTHLANYEFPLPPVDEQRRIADLLWAADDDIQKHNDIVEKSLMLKESLGLTYFSKESIDKTEKLHSLTTKIGSGKTPTGGEKVYTKKGILFLRSQNIYADGLHLEDVAYIPEEIDTEMASTRVKKNDVLLNITGASIGRCTLYKSDEPANVNQHVCIIRTTPIISPAFLAYYLQSQFGQQQISKLQTKGNREGLNFQQLGSFDIPVPSSKKQEEIVEVFENLEKAYNQTLTHIEALKILKKELLNKVLLG